MRIALVRVATLAAFGAFASAAPPSNAAGFGPVRSLSPTAGSVDQLGAAVTPTGETAVMWRRLGPRIGKDFEFVAAIGPDAEHLGPPRTIHAAGVPSKATSGRLLARPTGGFVACFSGSDGADDTFGCTFTDGSGDFGPLHMVQRRPSRDVPSHRMALRADGKLAIVLSHRVQKGRFLLRTTTLDDEGVLGPLRPLATISRKAQFSLATLDDGTTAVSLSTPQQRSPKAPWNLSLRTTAPGHDVFGAPRELRAEGVVQSGRGAGIEGGGELRISALDHDDEQVNVARRRANGTFSGPLRLPRFGPGLRWGPVVSLSDGTPLAITQAERQIADCAGDGLGVIGSGPLTPAGKNQSPGSLQRLSKPGQVAFNPLAATLADGTVIASWQNAASSARMARVEVAIRPAGSSAFLPSQVLPRLAQWWEHQLAAGGDQAVLAWIVGGTFDGPSRVVMSSLRQAPPYSTPARLSKRPRTPCG